MAINQEKCEGEVEITVDTTVFQKSIADAERALIERYRSKNVPDPDPKKPPKDNPHYVNCGGCQDAKNECHGFVRFTKNAWTEPEQWDTQVDGTGNLIVGKHFKYHGKIVITCKCEKKPAAGLKSIHSGQTFEQIEGILDLPTLKAVIGDKTIYSYPNIKVIFTGGLVSDVQ
jgi:hypothetical protein